MAEAERKNIYDFLDDKFDGIDDKMDKKFTAVDSRMGNIAHEMSELNRRMSIVESRERPAGDCRDIIFEIKGECEDKCNVMQTDMNNIQHKNVETFKDHELRIKVAEALLPDKVSYGKLYGILAAFAGFIASVGYFFKELWGNK